MSRIIIKILFFQFISYSMVILPMGGIGAGSARQESARSYSSGSKGELYDAIQQGQLQKASQLLAAGANPDGTVGCTDYPLEPAIRASNAAAVRLLLASKATVTKPGLIDRAVDESTPEVVGLLLEAKANANERTYFIGEGHSLMYAASKRWKGSKELQEVLAKHGGTLSVDEYDNDSDCVIS